MKKLLFTFFGLILLGTTCLWAHTGTQTALKRGVYKYVITKAQIMTDNNWTSGAKNTLTLGPDITYTGYGANSSIYTDDKTKEKWPRIYQTQNVVSGIPGGSVISANNGWIDSICIEYNVISNGVISLTKDNTSPVATQYQIASGKMHKVNAASFPFFIGSTSTNTNGRADITKITVYYRKYPTKISLQDRTISVGNRFQLLPDPTPADAYPSYTWSTDNSAAVAINTATGVLEAKAAGEATITATSINGKVASCKIKVEANDLKSFTDTLKSVTTTGYVGQTDVAKYTGDNGVFHWMVRNIRRASDEIVDGVQWTRMAYNSKSGHVGKDYIAYDDEYPMEGGVKRISFPWKAANGVNPVSLDIDNNGQPDGLVSYKTYLPAAAANKNVSTFTQDLNMAKNVQLRLSITAAEGAVVTFGPLTITPYLLYTNKNVDATDGFFRTNDVALINNTGITLTDANISVDNTAYATVDADGTIRSQQDNKKVTVTATWGSVTTTTSLTTHLVDPIASFENPTITANVGDDVTNTFTKTTGGAVTFESTSTSVATVDPATGKVTIVGGGATVIKAIIDAEAPYKAKTLSYTLFVNYTPTGGHATETFKNMAVYSTTTTTTIVGDNGFDKWYLKNVRRLGNDDKYKIEGKYCPRIEYLGCIASKDTLEGGIKDVSFDWKAFNTSIKTHFRVIVDTLDNAVENVYECAKGATPSGKQTYSHAFNVERNVKLYIQMDANHANAPYNDVQQTYPVIGDLRITPYLLYTNKDTAVYMKDSKTYTNLGLINNTGTAPEYSISCGTDTAEIDADGKVTIKKSATVTVTATWGNVSTTYRLTMHAKDAPTIKFADQVVDMNQAPFAPAPTEAPSGIGTPSYSSTDKSVVKVNATTGELTIVGQGYATINVHYTEGTEWAAADVSYKVIVTDPVGEGFVEETFTKDVIESKAAKDTIEGDIADWEYKYIRRDITQKTRPDTLRCGQRASQLKNIGTDGVDESYLLTTEPLEGGIKRVSFLWNNGSPFASRDHNFIVIAGNDKDTVIKTILAPVAAEALAVKDTIYNHNFLIKQNVTLSIRNNSGCYALIGNVKVTPYLLYTKKDTTIKAIDYVGKDAFVNNNLINNTGVELTAEQEDIEFTLSGDEGVATINKKGELTILKGGNITVQAKWKGVITTYKLHITKETPTIDKFYNNNIDILFQTYAPNPVAKIGDDTIKNAVFEYTIEDEKIVTRDDKGNFILKRTGKTNVTCKLVEGPTYTETSRTKWIDVKEPNAEKSWKETFSSLGEKTAFQGKIEIQGDKDVYPWQIRNYRRDFTNDLVNGEKGIQLQYGGADGNNYIAFKESKEMGGVKGYFFNWRIPETTERAEAKFSVRIQGSYDSTCVYKNVAAGEYFSCAKMINHTTDGMFRIGIPVANDNIVFGPITIVPYLLYSKRDTTIDAKEYQEKEWKFKQDLAINNTESGTIVYSLENEAKVANIATINSESGEVTIQGGGTVKVLATWNNISTSYNLTITVEETSVSFDEDAHTVHASEKSYTKTATKTGSSPKSVVYSFDGYHKPSTTIDSENGTVSFSTTDTVVVMATIAKSLPYPEDTARYTLYITSLDVPEIGFTDETKTLNMNESGYKNVLTTSEGVGDTTYTSSNERVAKVAADGTITVWGKGTTTITARVAETSTFAAAEASYELTIEEATDRAIVEIFENDSKWQGAVTEVTTIKGDQFDWSTYLTRHRKLSDKTVPDTLVSGERAVWFNNSGNAYLESADAIEGGIKRVAFNWNKATVANPKFTVIVGDTTDVVNVAEAGVDDSFCQNFFVKKNASLRINNNSASILLVGPINITPYLLFKGDKVMNIDMDEVTSFNLNDTLINNTQGEGTIAFAVDSYTTDVEPTISNGEIDLSKITKGGQVNISAKWGEGVATTLVINTKITPKVSFAEPTPAAQNLIDGSYTNVLNPMEGLGTITYESSNTNVATVDKNTGKVTFLIAGTTTITAKVAASDIYNKTEKSYNLTINGYTPTEGKSWTETFNSFALETSSSYISSTDVVGDSSVYNWKVLSYHRQKNDTILKEYGTRINANGSINSVDMEGGIKYLAFNWRPKNTADAIDFTVKVGENEYHYSSAKSSAKSIRYERFVNAKQNTTLTLKLHDWESGKAYICFGNITVVPYLLYTHKSHTMNMNEGATYKNESLIDNRDDDTAITYESSDKTIATVDADGIVTALKAGKVTITATWGKVSTTYELTIVAKTTITLMDNNGTEGKTVIENAVGDIMPKVDQPIKSGYQFNAYWIDEECKAKRFTVTMISKSNTDSTGWVSNTTYPDGGVNYIGSGRKWAYNGAELTLYAQYKQERTITLNNQGASKTGTDKVVIAYCPNNNTVNLMQPIEVPQKDNSTFLGYFIGATDGTQLIDATGAFIANVAGYIDTEENYKKWKYDKDITLYAHWKDSVVVTGETPASDIPANADLTITQTGVIDMGATKLTVTNLVINAVMGGTGTSGQIKGATNSNLIVNGDVFFDLTIDKSAPGKQPKDQWHAFTVPFQVSATEGVFKASDGSKLTNGNDYAFRAYNGAKRASGQNGWEAFSGTLQPGIFYVITINGDVPTFRFKKVQDAPIVTESKSMPVYNYGGSGGNYGWNGIGNSQLDGRYVNATVQVLDPASYTYQPYVAGDKAQFSVGTPFFYQATTDGEIELATEVPSSVAARAMSAEPKEIAIKLIGADFTDRLFISSTEGATNEYQTGRDLSKMSMTSTPAVPQIFAKAYNTKLCIIDAPMAGDEARYDLLLYAPKAGEYTLAAAQVEGYEIFLTNNGEVIWNLSKNDYLVDLDKGTTDAYGLILKKMPNTPTDISSSYTVHATPYTKFIYNNQLIIIRDGKQFNAQGALIK